MERIAGYGIIAPRRSNSAHLHWPWRTSTSEHANLSGIAPGEPTANLQRALFGIVVGGKWKVTLKVHPVVQDSYDFDRCFRGHPVHQEVASAPTMSCNVDRAKTWHDLISSLGACNIRTFGKFSNRLNERLLIDTRLLRAKILSGPFDDIRKVEFRDGTEANTPFPLGHWGTYPPALEMTFSERSFK
jgi:hypothetical protein